MVECGYMGLGKSEASSPLVGLTMWFSAWISAYLQNQNRILLAKRGVHVRYATLCASLFSNSEKKTKVVHTIPLSLLLKQIRMSIEKWENCRNWRKTTRFYYRNMGLWLVPDGIGKINNICLRGELYSC